MRTTYSNRKNKREYEKRKWWKKFDKKKISIIVNVTENERKLL